MSTPDLGLDYTAGIKAPEKDQADFNAVVNSDGDNLDYIRQGGTTAQRPISPPLGTKYYDTDTSQSLTWDGGSWVVAAGGGGSPTGSAGGDLSGSYPNPAVAAITSGGQSLAVGSIADGELLSRSGNTVVGTTITSAAPSGAAGGDLSGTYPNPAVAAITSAGQSLLVASVSDGEYLVRSGNTLVGGTPGGGGAPTGPAGGDLSGTYPNPAVAAITSGGQSLVVGAVADGETLVRSGNTVVGAAPSAGGFGTAFGPIVGVDPDGYYHADDLPNSGTIVSWPARHGATNATANGTPVVAYTWDGNKVARLKGPGTSDCFSINSFAASHSGTPWAVFLAILVQPAAAVRGLVMIYPSGGGAPVRQFELQGDDDVRYYQRNDAADSQSTVGNSVPIPEDRRIILGLADNGTTTTILGMTATGQILFADNEASAITGTITLDRFTVGARNTSFIAQENEMDIRSFAVWNDQVVTPEQLYAGMRQMGEEGASLGLQKVDFAEVDTPAVAAGAVTLDLSAAQTHEITITQSTTVTVDAEATTLGVRQLVVIGNHSVTFAAGTNVTTVWNSVGPYSVVNGRAVFSLLYMPTDQTLHINVIFS